MATKYSSYLAHDEQQYGHSHNDQNHNNIFVHGHDHDHSHNMRDQNSKILAFILVLTFIFAFVEAIGGHFTKSIALQTDALHMLTDAAGLLIAFLANKISQRAATVHLTFGYGKAEAIGSLINCLFTIILTMTLLVEAIQRFFIPQEVHGAGLFIIASMGFIVNIIIAFLLSKDTKSLNMKAVLIHTLGDLFASAIAIISGVIIYLTGINIVDPILSLVVIFILIISNYNLLKRSMVVLMAGVPRHLSYVKIGNDIEAIDGVLNIHDLHIWYMSTNQVALSAHVTTKYKSRPWEDILLDCQNMLLSRYNIGHITLQYEFKHHNGGTNSCATLN